MNEENQHHRDGIDTSSQQERSDDQQQGASFGQGNSEKNSEENNKTQLQIDLERAKTNNEVRRAIITQIQSELTALFMIVEMQIKYNSSKSQEKITEKTQKVVILLEELGKYPEEQHAINTELEATQLRKIILSNLKSAVATAILYIELLRVIPTNEASTGTENEDTTHPQSEITNRLRILLQPLVQRKEEFLQGLTDATKRIEPQLKIFLQLPDYLPQISPEAMLTSQERTTLHNAVIKDQDLEVYLLDDLLRIFSQYSDQIKSLKKQKQIHIKSLALSR